MAPCGRAWTLLCVRAESCPQGVFLCTFPVPVEMELPVQRIYGMPIRLMFFTSSLIGPPGSPFIQPTVLSADPLPVASSSPESVVVAVRCGGRGCVAVGGM